MTKLYSVRSRFSGFLVEGNGRLFVTEFLAPAESLAEKLNQELVTFREEPTEPCSECQTGVFFAYYQTKDDMGKPIFKPKRFCSECGRRLE